MRSDGKAKVQFVYPGSGARVTKLMTKEQIDQLKTEGNYAVFAAR
jgi:hypothetical protein